MVDTHQSYFRFHYLEFQTLWNVMISMTLPSVICLAVLNLSEQGTEEAPAKTLLSHDLQVWWNCKKFVGDEMERYLFCGQKKKIGNAFTVAFITNIFQKLFWKLLLQPCIFLNLKLICHSWLLDISPTLGVLIDITNLSWTKLKCFFSSPLYV